MKRLIAHRGLVDGADADKENTLTTLLAARSQGFEIETDLWYDNYKWYIGHDKPQWEINLKTLESLDKHERDKDKYNLHCVDHFAWLHCKNINALYQLRDRHWPGHYFYHENDPVVLTNYNHLWTFPGQQLTPYSICVLPEKTYSIEEIQKLNVYGFCSDIVKTLKDL
jgi:hypothetical protein